MGSSDNGPNIFLELDFWGPLGAMLCEMNNIFFKIYPFCNFWYFQIFYWVTIVRVRGLGKKLFWHAEIHITPLRAQRSVGQPEFQNFTLRH